MDLRNSLYALPNEKFEYASVNFKEIKTEDELIDAVLLELTPDEAEMVNPLSFSIGRAYLFPDSFVPYLIKNGDTSVGFILLGRYLGTDDDSVSWSYYIAHKYQKNGFGRAAAHLVVDILSSAVPNVPIRLSVEKDNKKAQSLYRSIGFYDTGRLDGDDKIFEFK